MASGWANRDNDLDTIVISKSKKGPTTLKSEKAVAAAQRSGAELSTEKKYSAATNKQKDSDKNAAKLDRETEELKHNTIGMDVGKLIQQGRQAKQMSQSDLAKAICEKPNVVTDYEKGASIPNQAILGKMEKALGMKLRGKDKGQPLSFGPKKK